MQHNCRCNTTSWTAIMNIRNMSRHITTFVGNQKNKRRPSRTRANNRIQIQRTTKESAKETPIIGIQRCNGSKTVVSTNTLAHKLRRSKTPQAQHRWKKAQIPSETAKPSNRHISSDVLVARRRTALVGTDSLATPYYPRTCPKHKPDANGERDVSFDYRPFMKQS